MIICALTKTKPLAFEDLWSPVFWFSLASAKRQNLESEQVGKWKNCLIFIILYFIFMDLKTSRFNLLVSYKYIKNRNSFCHRCHQILFALQLHASEDKLVLRAPGTVVVVVVVVVAASLLRLQKRNGTHLASICATVNTHKKTIDGHPSNIRIYVILVTCNGYMQ